MGPGDQIAQEWAKERAADSGATTTLDNLSIFHLPVGVRPLEELNDSPNISNTTQHPETKIGDEIKAQPLVTSKMPWDELTGAGFEAVMDLYNSASTVLKGKYADIPKKQGMLSVRAASMLVKLYFLKMYIRQECLDTKHASFLKSSFLEFCTVCYIML